MSFFSIISPVFKEQIPVPEETLENLKRCLAKSKEIFFSIFNGKFLLINFFLESDSADEARDWILVCVQENFRLVSLENEPVAGKCPEYPEDKSMKEILEMEERNFKADISEKEIQRRTTCIYQRLGLVKYQLCRRGIMGSHISSGPFCPILKKI